MIILLCAYAVNINKDMAKLNISNIYDQVIYLYIQNEPFLLTYDEFNINIEFFFSISPEYIYMSVYTKNSSR